MRLSMHASHTQAHSKIFEYVFGSKFVVGGLWSSLSVYLCLSMSLLLNFCLTFGFRLLKGENFVVWCLKTPDNCCLAGFLLFPYRDSFGFILTRLYEELRFKNFENYTKKSNDSDNLAVVEIWVSCFFSLSFRLNTFSA